MKKLTFDLQSDGIESSVLNRRSTQINHQNLKEQRRQGRPRKRPPSPSPTMVPRPQQPEPGPYRYVQDERRDFMQPPEAHHPQNVVSSTANRVLPILFQHE